MMVVDDDVVSAYSKEEINAFRGFTNIVGYGEAKLGGWDGDDDEIGIQIPAIQTRESISRQFDPNQIVNEEEDNEEIKKFGETGEAKWLEFQRKLEESTLTISEDKAKNQFFMDDPVMMAKKNEILSKRTDQIQGPPNRFGIKPGIWWDGIDRSNGFEKKRFERLNQQKDLKEREYKESVSTM
ncbi:BUD13 [Histomonas meleagridis]|uniref:BUD13-like n=1 Tax=Histomonas meleagridis TaxID=135588 RepID=UPI003559D668|nr:BUD13 [Histomonas meleagridis]KAH0804293.1 BUD13-like [Histomonas meleagridis]